MSNRVVVQTAQNQLNIYEGDLNVVGDTSSIINGEVPIGSVNGINAMFTLAHLPYSLVSVYVNGLLQHEGMIFDFTRSGTIITFTNSSKPQTGDIISVTYNYQA